MKNSRQSNPKVSIVIPYYNMGQYIQDTLDSIHQQTFKDYEVIIIDDGSTEKPSKDVLARLESTYKIIHQKNGGLSAARNTGVRVAKGKYISCMDPDDKYFPDFFKECVTLLDKDKTQKVGWVGTGIRLFGLRDDIGEPLSYEPVKLLYTNFFHSAALFRRSMWEEIGGYDESLKEGYEDWNFWISALERGYKWGHIRKQLLYYRIRENSMVNESNKKFVKLYSEIIGRHPDLFRKYSLELLKIYADSVNKKDELIGYLTDLSNQEKARREKETTDLVKLVNQERQENQEIRKQISSIRYTSKRLARLLARKITPKKKS